MALQSQRRTKSSKKRRASHFALKKKQLAKCPKCGKAIKPHCVCGFCGTYKGKEAIKIKSKVKKKV
ncbi:MAG: 50S ribosomal protein L32 [bacterium]